MVGGQIGEKITWVESQVAVTGREVSIGQISFGGYTIFLDVSLLDSSGDFGADEKNMLRLPLAGEEWLEIHVLG